MKRLIDADALRDYVGRVELTRENIYHLIDDAPDVMTLDELDGRVVKHPIYAKWELQPDRTCRCSNCGNRVRLFKPNKYCYNCGAEMTM